MVDDDVVYEARLHWVIFLWPVVFLIFTTFLMVQFAAMYRISALFCIVAILWIIMVWFTYHFSSLVIKKTNVILRTGFLVRQTMDFPLNKIESIDIRQSLLGSVFKYGSLVITGTGGSHQIVDYLNQPLTCRRYIEQLMHQ